jgi:hypothetical protein
MTSCQETTPDRSTEAQRITRLKNWVSKKTVNKNNHCPGKMGVQNALKWVGGDAFSSIWQKPLTVVE